MPCMQLLGLNCELYKCWATTYDIKVFLNPQELDMKEDGLEAGETCSCSFRAETVRTSPKILTEEGLSHVGECRVEVMGSG